MKLFSLILSVCVFFTSLYFLVAEIPSVDNLNDIIYVALLVILMAICIVGVIINWEFFSRRKKNKMILFVSNGFSDKTKK
jgi:membrane protein DedA with SNARE-associated domain